MKTAFAIGVLAVAFIPALARVGTDVEWPAPPPSCSNVIAHEPLLLYEVAGSSLYAYFDSTLTVYADGSLMLADASATDLGQCLRAQTTPRVALNLHQALVEAGGFVLCDDLQQVTDVPLHTLTMLNGTPDVRAHTFSYWVGRGGYAPVDALLEGFIAEHFPTY